MHVDDLNGDDDDLTGADFGNDLTPPAPPADPPPAPAADDPPPVPVDGQPPGGDPMPPPVDDPPPPAPPGDDEPGDKTIPYDRFKEVNDAKKALAAQLAEREAELAALRAAANPPAPPADPPADPLAELNQQRDELYEQIEELRLEGDVKAAAAAQRKLDDLNQEILLTQTRQIASTATAQADAAKVYNAYADAAEAAFPELVKGSDVYSAEKVNDVNLTATAFEKAGMQPLAALQKAIKLVMGETVEDRQAKKAAPPPASAAPTPPAAPPVKTPDLKKAVAAANNQPPPSADAGINRDDMTINPRTLTEEEFDALPISKQRELRGDFG